MPKTTQDQLDKAATLLNDAELDALNALSTAMEAFDKALEDISGLLPQVQVNSTAQRIANELRSQLSYRRVTEVPNAVRLLKPEVVEAPVPMPVAMPTPAS